MRLLAGALGCLLCLLQAAASKQFFKDQPQGSASSLTNNMHKLLKDTKNPFVLKISLQWDFAANMCTVELRDPPPNIQDYSVEFSIYQQHKFNWFGWICATLP
jgi:hypothetical protein